ncbi:hypothetical protein LCGC14_0363470 [marine sediment metagenome]|uniref:Uncharacterized protein n=1 Tax=marine sediment metagenome TaxID=412755 RepID=A0A0F9T7G0_9ZZZZ
MVSRTRLGGARSISGYARTMMPESIRKLASYIYVDKALLLKLSETGLNPTRVDELRAILLLNQNPGSDIGGPLDAYDALVMELATFIIEDNMDLIEDEIRKAQSEALGIGPEEEISEEIIEEVPGETIEERTVREAGVEREEVLIPEKIRVVSKKGVVTHRAKSVPYRKRGVPGLSSQEQFLYSRVGQPIVDTQHEYISRFKIYRTKRSLSTKQRRVAKRVVLSEKERARSEGAGKGMTPK